MPPYAGGMRQRAIQLCVSAVRCLLLQRQSALCSAFPRIPHSTDGRQKEEQLDTAAAAKKSHRFVSHTDYTRIGTQKNKKRAGCARHGGSDASLKEKKSTCDPDMS